MIYAGIDTSKLSETEVLFFIRIKGEEHFFDKIYSKPVINELFGHLKSFSTISEYKNADYYIDLKKFSVKDYSYNDFEIFNSQIKPHLASIIFRCRGLRAISFQEAKELILRATKFWIYFFEQNPNFKLIVIHIIDNYVLDILYRIANVYKVRTAVLSEFFIYGYRRHTIYGEFVKQREIDQVEIQDVVQYFERKEKSFWLKGLNTFSSIKYCSYLFFSYYARVFIRYYIGYKLFGNISYEHRFAKQFAKVPLKNFFSDKFFDEINYNVIEKEYNTAVYMPLHVYPEANVDYWINDPNDADYYTTIYEALSFFRDRNISVYIKEHPGFLYQRETEFYRTITSFSNVTLVHPFDKNVVLLDKIQNIMVWHGSAGVEGIMQGKKVVAYDNNFYSKNYIPPLKLFNQRNVFTKEERVNFMSDILGGAVKFNME